MTGSPQPDRQMDRLSEKWTDQKTNKASCRVACPQLKTGVIGVDKDPYKGLDSMLHQNKRC